MKNTIGIVLILLSLPTVCQQRQDTVSLHLSDYKLESILDSIAVKTGYKFSYNSEIIPKGSLYTIKKERISISELLDLLFIGADLSYKIINDQIVIRRQNRDALSHSFTVNKPDIITISGWVREYETRAPIVGVNVFVNGTTIGTITDEYGNYTLQVIKPGSYDIVFSHVSYEMASYKLDAESLQNYAVNGLLGFRVETLSFIEIVSDPLVSKEEWPKYYRIFVKAFFGTAANATKCEIVNKEVLEFSYDQENDLFKAEALEPLIIFNNALGYKITYDLESFINRGDRTSYYGKARFENLTPSSGYIKKKWKKARLRSYRGSIFHFMKALTMDKLEEQGFKVFRIDDLGDIYNRKMVSVETKKIIKQDEKPYQWKLDFNGMLVVKYEREFESVQYVRDLVGAKQRGEVMGSVRNFNGKSPDVQKSIIELNRTYVTIDKNGQIVEPLGVSTIGYWAWERLSDLVPANYNPKSDNL